MAPKSSADREDHSVDPHLVDAIVAGVGPVTQTFEIEGPRKAGKGKFVLVVNGNELVRQ